MSRKTRRALVLLLAGALLTVAACSAASQANTGATYEVIHVSVDGRQISCIITGGNSLSCDWSAK